MSKHIPGPWTVEIVRGTEAYFAIKADLNFGRVCYIPHSSTVNTDEANAHFIAAAPDLYAAAVAQEAAEDFNANECPDCKDGDGEENPENCGRCFPFFDEARCLRRAALAKAEGRS
jgi:hypothetical protein